MTSGIALLARGRQSSAASALSIASWACKRQNVAPKLAWRASASASRRRQSRRAARRSASRSRRRVSQWSAVASSGAVAARIGEASATSENANVLAIVRGTGRRTNLERYALIVGLVVEQGCGAHRGGTLASRVLCSRRASRPGRSKRCGEASGNLDAAEPPGQNRQPEATAPPTPVKKDGHPKFQEPLRSL